MTHHHEPILVRRLSRRSLLGLLGAVSVAAGGMAAIPSAAGASSVDDGQLDAFDDFVRQRAAEDQFSGTVLLVHADRRVLARAYGMANKQLSIPNRLDTLFNLASVTKIFTALAVSQLAEQGKVAFHKTLGTYLDGFSAEIANTVTVHQLLTHTSGIGGPGSDYVNDPAFRAEFMTWTSAAQVMDGVMAIIRRMPLRFTPGTTFSYSNTGYVILGAIVAQVTGQSYFDYVRQHIFAPARMSRTDFYTRPQVLADRDIAHLYATLPTGGPRFDVTQFKSFVDPPDHGAYSTATDLARFARALRAGKLLSPSYTELVTSGKLALAPGSTPAPPGQSLFTGYGVDNTILNNQRIFGHSGSAMGVATNVDIYPDLDWVAVVLSNYDTTISPIVIQETQLITRRDS
jgi:CubicO group peptidase (beta-lactamase class C family)